MQFTKLVTGSKRSRRGLLMKLLKRLKQDFFVGWEVGESRMSHVQRRVHHTVEPCADPVRGSVEPCLMRSRWIRSEKRKTLTTRLSNILRNPHQFWRTLISRRNRGCSTRASRSVGKWRGRCVVRAAGRLGILNGVAPRAPTTTLTRKPELMLLGFISLLLTVAQTPISNICVSKSVGSSMRPCSAKNIAKKEYKKNGEKFLLELAESYIPRRSLATKGVDKCAQKGQVAFVSAYGIHQLHIFIFVLALVHVIYCIVTYALGKSKMSKWKQWEDDTKTLEYEYSNDQERFRFAKDTSFGRRHLSSWSNSNFTLWTVCFFRQFFGSVTEVDYKTLRRGFITALVPGSGSEKQYDFFNYIQRSLEKDFKTVVEISPVIWFVTVLFLLTNSDGLHSYLWLPFIPLIVVLIVGTKLQVIITKLGLRILEKGDVVRGAPVVQPGDDLFWFDSPSVMLFLIHLVLFSNAFQLAFFAWSSYEFGFSNCFHKKPEDIAIRIGVGVVVQILCSYVTLPLYALVIQMGTRMKPTVFNKRVSTMLKKWHHTAQNETQHRRLTESNTPHPSRPTTPSHDSSPIHLLHNSNNRSGENFPPPPPSRHSDHHDHHQFYDPESQHQAAESSTHHSTAHESASIELPTLRPANP